MLFECDIFNINLCEILNKNQFLCPKIHYYSFFINFLASILNLCSILAHLCHLGEIFSSNLPKIVKISIFVSMATMEATWLLGMFQLQFLEGY